MATYVKARVDVAVSTYMEIDAVADQPATTVGLKQDQLPTGYFSGGSHLQTVASDNDITYNSIAGVVMTGGAAYNAATQIIAGGDDASGKTSGVLVLRNSGKTTAAKTVAANTDNTIEIFVGTASATTKVTTLGVANKDVFVIPNVTQAMTVFEARAIGTGDVFLEYTCVCD
jgi:hypothetical protein|tara:strand:+ start:2435 stop:2950 length:516 start_codon:yes stop_codon:yes gene_type:complete